MLQSGNGTQLPAIIHPTVISSQIARAEVTLYALDHARARAPPPPKLELVEAEIERRSERDVRRWTDRGREREGTEIPRVVLIAAPASVFAIVHSRPANAIVEIGVDYAFAPAACALHVDPSRMHSTRSSRCAYARVYPYSRDEDDRLTIADEL